MIEWKSNSRKSASYHSQGSRKLLCWKSVMLLMSNVLLLCSSSVAEGTIITSVGYIFEAFSPYTMIRFFEFSDKGWNISANCLKDMYSYLEGLRTGTLWAVKLYDACSYYSGGLFGASTVRIHNPNLCRALLQQHQLQVLHESLDVSPNATVVPFPVHVIVAHYLIEITDSSVDKLKKIQQLVCFPISCTNSDLEEIFEVYLFQSNHVVRNITYLRHRILNEAYSTFEDFDFSILIFFILGPIFIYIVVYLVRKNLSMMRANRELYDAAKVSDQFNRTTTFERPIRLTLDNLNGINFIIEPFKEKPAYNRPKIVTKSRSHLIKDVLNAVTLPNVLYNLFQPNDTTPQAGLFVLFTMFFIYAHLAAEVGYMSNNLDYPEIKESTFVLKHASFIIDVYFFLSFLPSYTFCLFAEHLLDKHLHNSIAMEIPSYDYNNCKDNKLSNMLYMDTFFPLSERCMPWIWFMSLEIQFFIIACLVLLLAEIHLQYSVIIGVTIFILSALGASCWQLNNHIGYEYMFSIEYELTEFNLIFDNVFLRIIPYLLGMCLGYLQHKNNFNFNLNVFLVICGWIASVLLLLCYFFGYEMISNRLDRISLAFLDTLTHAMWSMIIFFAILTSATKCGGFLGHLLSFPYSHTLQQLSSICLLIAPIIIRLFMFTIDAPIYFSAGHILQMSVGCILTAYLSALMLRTLLDGPLNEAVKEIIKSRK